MKINTFSVKDGSYDPTTYEPIQDSAKTLVMMFGGSKFFDKPEAIGRVCEAYGDTFVIGCSTSGEIFDTEIHDDSLAVGVLEFEQATLKRASAPIQDAAHSFGAGEVLGRELDGVDLRGVFVLSDGLNVNGSELVRGLNSVLSKEVVVTGGLAGDGDRFQRTWVIQEGRPQSGFITAIGFYGETVNIGHGSKGGWDLFGPERRVTRSEGNVLFELDGKPALELYKEYLGERASELPASGLFFPLALRTGEASDDKLVRTILAVDEEQQSMTFAGNIPQDALVQMMRANFDRLVSGASEAASLTGAKENEQHPMLAIAISCVGRRLVLGERTEEEVEATLDILPAGTKQIGFYSYGELSPYANGRCNLHNQTMTLTTIYEG